MWHILKKIFGSEATKLNTSSVERKSRNVCLQEAGKLLAESLHLYSESAYSFYDGGRYKEDFEAASINLDESYNIYRFVVEREMTNEEVANKDKMNIAKQIAIEIVTDGRIGEALCENLAQAVGRWPDDYDNTIDVPEKTFKAHNVRVTNKDYGQSVTVRFSINEADYIFILKDNGSDGREPGTGTITGDVVHYNCGELELHFNNEKVVHFDITGEWIIDEYSDCQLWEFKGIKTFHAGSWMKDIVDIGAQIKANEASLMVDREGQGEADDTDIKL